MGRYGGLTRLFAAINLLTLLESTGAFKPVVKPLQGQGRADPLWSFASTSQQEELSAKVTRVLSAPRLRRVEVVEAIQGLQWALLDAERRGGDVKDKLLEAYKEARDEARRADALAHDLEAANMRNLILARTVNARAALERIQEKILKKPGAKMDEKDWSKYVDSRPALKARMLEQAPRWAKTLGRDILSIWQITNQRANGEQVGDVIEVFQEWFTREQIWVLGCILTEESYPWTALPAREGFSHVEQKRAMGLKKKKD